MNKEDYVSLEVAKLLKKEGFNDYCGAYYHLNWDKDSTEEELFEIAPDHDFRNANNGYRAGAPTLYDAQKWFRNERGIFIEVGVHYNQKCEIVEYEYRITTYFYLLENPHKWKVSKEYYEKHEECLNAGILAALKKIDHETKIP